MPESTTNRKLSQSHTAELSFLNKEFSTYFKKLTPSMVWKILEDARQGYVFEQYKLFEQMEQDPEIGQCIDKRKRAALALSFDVYPWDSYRDKDGNIVEGTLHTATEQKQTELVRELIRNIPDFEDLILGLGNGIGNGVALLECADDENRTSGWKKIDGYYIPQYILRPTKWIIVDQDDMNHLLLRTRTGRGEEFNKFGWIIHKHKTSSGFPTDNGIYSTLVWTYLFRKWTEADIMEFLDIYGLPMIFGRYESDTEEGDQLNFKKALFELSRNAKAIFPNTMDIEVLQNVAQGRIENYIEWYNLNAEIIQKRILGATLTSQVDGAGSYAATEVHKGETFSLVISDVKQYESTLRDQLIYPISFLNTKIDNKNRLPRLFFDVRVPDDKERFLNEMQTMYKLGYELREDVVEERFRGIYVKRKVEKEVVIEEEQDQDSQEDEEENIENGENAEEKTEEEDVESEDIVSDDENDEKKEDKKDIENIQEN